MRDYPQHTLKSLKEKKLYLFASSTINGVWRLTKPESDSLVVENQLRKREGKFGVCESMSESLMWACEALMLGFLDSLREEKKTCVIYLICGAYSGE